MKYIQICKRNAVTKKDLEMALKFQTLRFFQNPELENELTEMKQEIRAELDGEYYSDSGDSGEGVWEDIPEGEGETEAGGEAESGEGEVECEGNPEEAVEVYSLEDGLTGILQQFTLDDGESDDFARANLRETDVVDRNFVVDFHKCCDSWDTWQPENDMQKTLFNAIESMTAQF